MDAIAIPLTTLLFVAILLLVLLILAVSRRNGDGMKVCGTRGCVQHAVALGIDKSRGPLACEDFSTFICPSWKLGDVDVVTTVNAQAVLLWVISVEKMSMDAYEREAVVNRPLSMMRDCMHRPGDDSDSLMSLLELVDRSRFAWPTLDDGHRPPITDYSRPLQLLLELSVLWQLPLWFRIHVLPAKTPLQRGRAVVLSPSALSAIWHGLHQTLLLYEEAYSIYLSFFNNSIFKYRPPSESFASFLTTGVNVQTQVLGHLSSAFHDTYKQPRLVEIRSLPTWIRKVGAEEWAKALGSVFGTHQNITVSDLLLATNENMLKAADSIFNAFTAQDVFFHTIWWFVQSVGAATSNKLFLTLNEHPSGKYFQRIICFDHVSTTYNALLASIHKTLLSPPERLSIVGLLENVRAVALEKLRSYATLNATTRKVLAVVLENMSTVLWPDDDFGRPGGFQQFYGKPYRGKDGFFGEWRWSRLQIQNRSKTLFTSKEYVAAAEVYSFVDNRLVSYNPILNTMSVSMAALRPPFYYKDGTSAMTYAGLGYIYAQEIFEALDMLTHLFNGGTVMKPTDAPDTAAFWNASWCPASINNRFTYPELPALDVAYTAYVKFKDGASDLPLKGLPHFRPEKIFFATFCHCSCYFDPSKRVKVSQVCKAAAQNFDPFSSAFSCPAGSEMNKSPKCAYA
ncbi:hypothetical protein V5799_015243 [Amblyomma americanum]|uniref:Peptidase M13 C-terminal domain-containing protein n=1 Tax=Amblyomma americanum TaxID=6943 RepID=A0AAQ4E0Q2_AMBAM